MNIIDYQASLAPIWNDFCHTSRNGTFMFNRDYMDYHAARFTDCSVVIESHDKPIALLAANRVEDKVISHGGLTFGGLVLGNKTGAAEVVEILHRLREHWAQQGIKKLIYKPVPHIYHRVPSEEDLYALHSMQAKPIRVDVSTTIAQSTRLPLSKGRKYALSKARKAGVSISLSEDYATCWQMLTDNLQDRHGVAPTHSLAEIQLLASRCPQIKLYMAHIGEQAVAAVLIYDFGQVAHTQYIALNDIARETGALDLLLETLISEIYADKPYFNFGISTCNNGQYFNQGLAAQKEMFGGRTTILQWLELEIA
jgi:hypothetical protein